MKLKSKFQTQGGVFVDIELNTNRFDTMTLTLAGIGSVQLNLSEVEILRDEFERFARAMNERPNPPSVRPTLDELRSLVEALDWIGDDTRSDPERGINKSLRTGYDKLVKSWRAASREHIGEEPKEDLL